MLISNNEYQHSVFFSSCNRLVGSWYSFYSEVTDYFSLTETNSTLAKENAYLRNKLASYDDVSSKANFEDFDDAFWHYIPARVINITLRNQKNFLTLNKGMSDGVEKDMGVVCSDGVVGVVNNVSNHFCTIIPIINVQSSVSCRFKKNDYLGTFQWDGINPYYGQLEDIARHMDVKIGDTLVTSGLSAIYKEGELVGTVKDVSLTENDAYYNIKVALSVDFSRLKYVYIVGHKYTEELKQIQEALK